VVEDYASWFDRWSKEMATDGGSGKVPPPTEATFTSGGAWGGKPGFKRFGRNRARSRVPGYGAAQTRKL
jgi:hypothetical protein